MKPHWHGKTLKRLGGMVYAISFAAMKIAKRRDAATGVVVVMTGRDEAATATVLLTPRRGSLVSFSRYPCADAATRLPAWSLVGFFVRIV